MTKLFVASLAILAVLWCVVAVASARPDTPHPGRPLGELPPAVSTSKASSNHKPERTLKKRHGGSVRSGCNRIAPNSGTCDTLQYINPDWTGYANGTANRDLL